LVLNIRESISDSDALDATTILLDGSSKFSYSDWSFRPSLAYRYKSTASGIDSDRYQGGLLVSRQISEEALEWQIGFKLTYQDSNFDSSSYNDTMVYTGINWFY
jgi:hypothetical protein